MKKKYRIFIGPIEIAGYYRNLSEGFRQIGVPCDFITYHPHPFEYGGETKRPVLLHLAHWFNHFRGKPGRSLFAKIIFALPGEILHGLWALCTIIRYDVFIFGFGSSLLRNNLDLPILNKLGKTVISNLAHGSEARPPYIDGAYQSKDGEFFDTSQIYTSTLNNKKKVICHASNCTLLLGAPFSTTHFSSTRLISSLALGLPIKLNQGADDRYPDFKPIIDESKSRPIRILHSPSHPAAKGSPQIIRAVDNLKQRGFAIEFILIHGRSFKDVFDEIKRCDFVVDQIYSDTPMAGFATEAAWFGKPAVVGGYGLNRLKRYVPEDMWPPSKTCHPDQIEEAIEELIVDVDQRVRLGCEAQSFVREKWNATAVAGRYLRLIEGEIPEEWWLNPDDVLYLEGAGQSVSKTKQIIRDLVSSYDVQALQLSHRPALQTAFLEFAGINNTK